MSQFQWKSLAVIRDVISKDPRASRAMEECRAVLELLKLKRDVMQSLIVPVDSSLESPRQVLLEAGNFSRSKTLLTNG